MEMLAREKFNNEESYNKYVSVMETNINDVKDDEEDRGYIYHILNYINFAIENKDMLLGKPLKKQDSYDDLAQKFCKEHKDGDQTTGMQVDCGNQFICAILSKDDAFIYDVVSN